MSAAALVSGGDTWTRDERGQQPPGPAAVKGTHIHIHRQQQHAGDHHEQRHAGTHQASDKSAGQEFGMVIIELPYERIAGVREDDQAAGGDPQHIYPGKVCSLHGSKIAGRKINKDSQSSKHKWRCLIRFNILLH
ncbi:hypothetical protein GCM10023143_30050 [Compostibacter hankyongensis]|uniref:Uncharacterized protein n=1 Tax=Compostibacter hankyongensis TaxID=1007089 RepID=A0ABP8G5L9_9BACT